MPSSSKRTIAFISSYRPRRCGIATFCRDLISSISQAVGSDFDPLVVALTARTDQQYKDPVKFEIRKKVKNDYISAADYLNFSHVDLVSVQHEFGLFGGPAGTSLNLLLEKVNAPVVTTLHTVLEEPSDDYFKATIDICSLSDKVIVMNDRGISMLVNIYGIERSKILLIPHGIPDLPFVDSSYYKHKFGVEGRRTILTFGLLSRNKGIETMLKALPEIVQTNPKVLYIILGATHPEVLQNDGEEYRFELQRIVDELGMQNHVLFFNQFVSDEQLHNFLCAADLYVTPYLKKQQLTSGTLAYAVGTGKAVVSTPYWAAEELLSHDRGRLVGFHNPKALAKTIIELIQNDSVFFSLRRNAYDYGRNIIWPIIGEKYWDQFCRQPARISPPSSVSNKIDRPVLRKIPEPSLQHLIALTDDTGLYQHARFTLPDRNHGYCTDDNARALIVVVKYLSQYNDLQARSLLHTYLSFVLYAQKKDGTFHNFMGFDRQWMDSEPPHDALGRSLWALGSLLSRPHLPELVPILKEHFDKSAKHVSFLSPRGKAYCLFAMAEYLKQFPGASQIKRFLTEAASDLNGLFHQNKTDSWRWFEDILSYDNAVLPHGLFVAYRMTGETQHLQTAVETCDFLLEKIYNGRYFSFIGCQGWYRKGLPRARFDQQPIEAASTVIMLRDAYEATGNRRYLELQKIAFDWFLGKNDVQVPLYDFRTKGCYDGLQRNGVNLNQGAESIVSYLLALMSIIENYSIEKKSSPGIHPTESRDLRQDNIP